MIQRQPSHETDWDSPRGDTIHLATLLGLGRRYVTWFLVAVVVGSLSGFAYCWVAEPTFHSQAEILVMRKSPIAADSEASENLDEEILATHLQILRSPSVIAKALAVSGLADRSSILKALNDDQTPAEYVIENLQTHKGGEGSGRAAQVLHLRLRHCDAADCQAILDAIVDGYRGFLREMDQRHDKAALAFAHSKRNQTAAELARREQARRTLRESSPFLWKGQETLNGPRLRAERLETELTSLRQERTSVEASLSRIRNAAVGKPATEATYAALLPLVAPDHLEQLKARVALRYDDQETQRSLSLYRAESLRLQDELAHFAGRYGVDHPEMVRVRRRTKQVDAYIAKHEVAASTLNPRAILASYVAFLRGELASLRHREAAASVRLTKATAEAKELIQFELEEQSLLEQVAHQQRLLAQHEEFLLNAELAADADGFSTEEIAPAQLGERISPRWSVMIPAASFLAVVFTVLAICLREMLQPLHAEQRPRQSQSSSLGRLHQGHPRWVTVPSMASR